MKFMRSQLIPLLAFFTYLLWGQVPCLYAQAYQLDFIQDQNIFYDQQGNPYLEIYIFIDGQSLQYQLTEDRLFRAKAEVELILKSDGENIIAEKYDLISQGISDTSISSKSANHLLDVRRFSLKPGVYVLSSSLKDAALPESDPLIAIREFECNTIDTKKPSFSDIEFFISRNKPVKPSILTKPDGRDYVPLVSNSSFLRQDSINFYLEVYNTQTIPEDAYLISASIRQVNAEQKLDNYTYTVKRKPSAFEVFSGTLTISSLPSQTYILSVEVFNLKRELIAATSKKFYVFNDAVDPENLMANLNSYDQIYGYAEEELNKHIQTLRFISSSTELSFAKVLSTYEEKKNFFVGFWDKRKYDPIKYTQVSNWQEFYNLVKYANQNFKSKLRPGWETDRGRILLMYGIPNDIQNIPSMNNTVPYDIWTYNKLGVQPGVIFVFADTDLITNEYTLLHSTKFGEANNPRWRLDLLSRFKDSNTVDFDNIDRNRDIRQEFYDITPR